MGQGVAGLVAGSLHADARQLLDKIGGLLPSMAAAVTVLLITWGLATLATGTFRINDQIAVEGRHRAAASR
jgi:hypothetical protein